MTKEELVARLRDIQSFDFEANVLKSGLLMNLCQVNVFAYPQWLERNLISPLQVFIFFTV